MSNSSDIRMKILTNGAIKPETYEVDDSFKKGEITFNGVHTMHELHQLLEKDSKIELEGWFLAGNGKKVKLKKITRDKFLEKWKENGRKNKSFKKFFESFNGGDDYGAAGNLIGDDYVPLLGGPFNKNLYFQDFLRMFALGFFAYNHDPVGRAYVKIMKQFTLGRGFRVDSTDEKALAIWRAFEKANSLQETMGQIAEQLCYNGEVMDQWLPNNEIFFSYDDRPGQAPPKGVIPRLRLIDPSTVWEVITYPEDITRVIAYQQVFPTQYQIYTADDKGSRVPTSKFIVQQIPAAQVDHFKINCADNEKRGRSDFYPVFGYMKRLRDSVEYSLAALQKAAAWAIDTTIEGSPTDIEAYIQEQMTQKTIPPAGSEFIHGPKIKREYRGNEVTGSSGNATAFEWNFSMIATGLGIPISFFATHLSAGASRASAVVATEPVIKKFEDRQNVYENIIKKWWNRLMLMNGMPEAECEITFPELISQDRSAKIKDTVIAKDEGIISHETMSNIISKELHLTSYDYDTEMEKIKKERELDPHADDILIAPLTANPAQPTSSKPGASEDPQQKSSAVTGDEKRKLNMNNGA